MSNLVKKITMPIVYGYLILGFLYQLIFYDNINMLYLATWLHIIFWLPMVILHWFRSLFITFILFGAGLYVLCLLIPNLRKFVVYEWNKYFA